jgi:short-subunit dehydrogenase
MRDNKNIIISGVGKGIGKDLFYKSVEISNFTIGVVRNYNDFKSINLVMKKKNKKNYKIFFGDIKNKILIKKIIFFLNKNNILINGLINNSGERLRKKFLDYKDKDIRDIFENNFFCHFYLMQELIRYFKKNKKGFFSIVNIGSIVGVNGFSELSGYASTKSALEALTKCLATEFGNEKIKNDPV